MNRHMKVQFMMKKIGVEIEKFVKEIIADMGLESNFAYKIDGDGKLFHLQLHNIKTQTTIGKSWTYEEICKMCLDKRIEITFNTVVREMVLKSETPAKKVKWI